MDNFPDFMKHPANRIAPSSQSTRGVEGYVFDGVDGSQMAFWTCRESAVSTPHVHDYDEYFVVLQGCYTLTIDDKRIPVRAGEEHFIPKGTWHGVSPSPVRERSMPSGADAPKGFSRRTAGCQSDPLPGVGQSDVEWL
jgi:quercetin dioxygenase-like cupin family protein